VIRQIEKINKTTIPPREMIAVKDLSSFEPYGYKNVSLHNGSKLSRSLTASMTAVIGLFTGN